MLTDPKEDYARGFIPFLGQKILLDSKPLIPRPETEFWVEKAIQEIPLEQEMRVLDLFAGSGCIGIAVLAHVPAARVTFAEKERRHLSTIRKSLAENHIDPERASIVESDVWRGVAGPFEYVFANPPYVSRARDTADASVIAEEPHEALYAEDDGFALIQATIDGLPRFLVPGGVCFIEHEPFHAERVQEAAAKQGFAAAPFPDQYGVVRYSRVAKPVS